jgi:hypothetical protein
MQVSGCEKGENDFMYAKQKKNMQNDSRAGREKKRLQKGKGTRKLD